MQGYFKFGGQDTQEAFSLIFARSRSSTTGYVKKTSYFLGGYGENDIGPFTLEGTMTLRPQDKMTERDGFKGYKKLKVAEFSLTKVYQRDIIEDLVD
jgi:hypothetical protein